MNQAEKETFRKLEQQRQNLADLLADSEEERRKLQAELVELNIKNSEISEALESHATLAYEGQVAHREDIEELEMYKEENRKFAEALQTIADGRGKYAKVARDVLI
jgi:septal ring factor EnvC (AmiA/AmiB activator)